MIFRLEWRGMCAYTQKSIKCKKEENLACHFFRNDIKHDSTENWKKKAKHGRNNFLWIHLQYRQIKKN